MKLSAPTPARERAGKRILLKMATEQGEKARAIANEQSEAAYKWESLARELRADLLHERKANKANKRKP